ncbi:MAG: hypothetical protein WC211_01225 [Dehalococcoidia bacterium]
MPGLGVGARFYGAGDSAQGRAAASYVVADVTGLQNLIAHSDELAEKAIRYVAFRTAGEARLNIRDQGAIDTSYMVNTTRARRLGRFMWSIGTAAFYGVFIEYGTIRMAARPWLMPAMGHAWQLLEQILRAALPDAANGRVNIPEGQD